MFNQSVDNLLETVTYLSFGYGFDKNANILPDELKHLTFNQTFNISEYNSFGKILLKKNVIKNTN